LDEWYNEIKLLFFKGYLTCARSFNFFSIRTTVGYLACAHSLNLKKNK